jgi:hypothetical protein
MVWKYYCQISSDLVVPIARYGNLNWRVKKRGFQAANREYYIAKCVYAIVAYIQLTKHLLPAIKELSGDYFTFQQDSAPAHRAKETVELLSRETPDFITPLQWPPNSPDLNPVDYKVWSVLQERVYRSQIRDVEHLKVRLVEEWRLFSQNIVDAAVKQWRVRLRACVKADGGHFEHQL